MKHLFTTLLIIGCLYFCAWVLIFDCKPLNSVKAPSFSRESLEGYKQRQRVIEASIEHDKKLVELKQKLAK